MAFIPLPNGIKVEFIFRKNNAPVVNIVFLQDLVGSPTLSRCQEAANAMETWWDTYFKADTVTSMALEEIRATDISEEDSFQYVNVISPAIAGTNAGADLPSNVAAVVTFYTPYAGRSFRGRNYVCGIPETQITANQLTTTYLAAIITNYAALGVAADDISMQHVVASFYHNNAPRETGVATPIIDYGGDNVVDTQRRRIPRSFS